MDDIPELFSKVPLDLETGTMNVEGAGGILRELKGFFREKTTLYNLMALDCINSELKRGSQLDWLKSNGATMEVLETILPGLDIKLFLAMPVLDILHRNSLVDLRRSPLI